MFNNIWRYNDELKKYLKRPFNGVELISRNYSQAWQDMFVLYYLKGKKFGTYLEIGGNDPINNNNTYLLSSMFSWFGLTIEYDPSFINSWNINRPKQNLLVADALSLNYSDVLANYFSKCGNVIDYLQLDIDPSLNTLRGLENLPLNDWKFSIISFETDAYSGNLYAREKSREILSSHGYKLLIPNIGVHFSPISNSPIPFEDWWVHADVFDEELDLKMIGYDADINLPQNFLFREKE